MLYRVKTPIRKDHVNYQPGSEIELDDATAQKISHAVEGPIGVEVLPLDEPFLVIVNGREVDINAPDTLELGTGKRKKSGKR